MYEGEYSPRHLEGSRLNQIMGAMREEERGSKDDTEGPKRKKESRRTKRAVAKMAGLGIRSWGKGRKAPGPVKFIGEEKEEEPLV